MRCLFVSLALNLHLRRPPSVTSGWLFHRAIRREIAVPSFVLMAMVQQSYPRHPPFHRAIRREIAAPSSVLMGDGTRELPPSSVIPPRKTMRNGCTIIRFDGRWCKEVTPTGLYFRQGRVDERSEIYPVSMTSTTEAYPLGGCTFFNSPCHFPFTLIFLTM